MAGTKKPSDQAEPTTTDPHSEAVIERTWQVPKRITLPALKKIGREVLGIEELRPGQPEALKHILAKKNVLVVMPTGGGKSLCYQIPALVRPGLTLVVSPLIALMQDQVAALERLGIAAALVNSMLTSAEIDERLRRAAAGRLKLLYIAPERFDSGPFRRALQRMSVGMVAIDEAHCVSEWNSWLTVRTEVRVVPYLVPFICGEGRASPDHPKRFLFVDPCPS